MTRKEIEALAPTDLSANAWLRLIAILLAQRNEPIVDRAQQRKT
jgi:hypothetical protein